MYQPRARTSRFESRHVNPLSGGTAVAKAWRHHDAELRGVCGQVCDAYDCATPRRSVLRVHHELCRCTTVRIRSLSKSPDENDHSTWRRNIASFARSMDGDASRRTKA